MAERTGSFPLMNLAQDYGVDYGDLLLWADYLRRSRGRQRMSAGYFDRFAKAHIRLGALSGRLHGSLVQAMVGRANARWGEPEVIHV